MKIKDMKSPEFNPYTKSQAEDEALKMQEKIKSGEANNYSEAEKQIEQEVTKEEAEIIELNREITNLVEEFTIGNINIGELSKKLEECENKNFSNIPPRNIEMPKVYESARGAILDLYNEKVKSGSPEFDNYIESNTDIKEFMREFNSAEDKDYDNFKKILSKYKFGDDCCIGYYKMGVSGSRPQRMTFEVYGDKRKEYMDKFFGKEENYDEKMIIFERKKKILSDFHESLEKLRIMCEIDKKLIDLKEKTGMDKDELQEYFKVDNLVANYKKLNPLIETMIKSELQKEKIFARTELFSSVKGDYKVEDIPMGAEYDDLDVRELWVRIKREYPAYPVKIYAHGISIVAEGKMGIIKNNPYMEYDDFEGGKTRKYPENKIEKLVNIRKLTDGIEVAYINGNKENETKILKFEE